MLFMDGRSARWRGRDRALLGAKFGGFSRRLPRVPPTGDRSRRFTIVVKRENGVRGNSKTARSPPTIFISSLVSCSVFSSATGSRGGNSRQKLARPGYAARREPAALNVNFCLRRRNSSPCR
jgi:hypothetical protein